MELFRWSLVMMAPVAFHYIYTRPGMEHVDTFNFISLQEEIFVYLFIFIYSYN